MLNIQFIGNVATRSALKSGIIARAFTLADSGGFSDVWDMRSTLKNEGFSNVDQALVGRQLRADLRRRCSIAKGIAVKETKAPKLLRRKSRFLRIASTTL